MRLAFAVGAAHSLRSDGAVFESTKLLNVFEHLENPIAYAVDMGLAAEEQMMREPDRLVICGPLRNRTPIHGAQIERRGTSPAQGREIGGINREQRTLVNWLVEKTAAWGSFLLQSRDEGRTRNIIHLFRKILHDVAVRGQARDTRFRFQQSDAASVTNTRLKVLHVFLSDLGLTGKALKLSTQHCRLKLTQAIIESNHPMFEFVGDTGSPGVDVALHPLVVLQVVGDDSPAFA